MPAEEKASVFGGGGEGSLASSGTPRKEVAIGFGHGGRGWNRIIGECSLPPLLRRLSDRILRPGSFEAEQEQLIFDPVAPITDVMKDYNEGEAYKPSRMIIFDAPPNGTAEQKTATRMSQQAPGGRRYKDAR